MEPGTVVNGYRVLSKLGEGSYGDVYKVVSEMDGKEYALKHSNSPNHIPNDWIREINIAVLLKEVPFVAQMKYYFWVGYSDYYLVYDLEKGDLESYINNTPWETRMENLEAVYRQLVNGAFAMNCRGIYHSDIKPGNILFSDGSLKYNDFGLSLVDACDDPQVIKVLGSTHSYRAPEYAVGKITNKTDGYVVALVTLKYITGLRFPDYTVTDVYDKLETHLSKLQFKYIMDNHLDIIDEMESLLIPDYTQRMLLENSKFCDKKNFQIRYIGESLIALSQDQRRRFAINLKMIERKCNPRSYAVAYDCLVRYYRQDNFIDRKIIHAICNLANNVSYVARRRRVLVRKTPEEFSKKAYKSSELDHYEKYTSDFTLFDLDSEDFTEEPSGTKSQEDGFSNLEPPTFGSSSSLEPPTFDSSSSLEPPSFNAEAREVGPFILEAQEYKDLSATAQYYYDNGNNYDYTITNQKDIMIEIMVLYKLNGCIAGCWQDPLRKAFAGLSSREITLLLVDKMTTGADMFGNYCYLDPNL